jgi:lipopolysaccharide transport system permease protein
MNSCVGAPWWPQVAEVVPIDRMARRLVASSRAGARQARSEWRLTASFARRQLHSQYRQSALSVVWSLLQPLALVVVYAVVFSQILRVEGGGLPYLSFVVAGLVVWRFFNAGINQANCFIDRSDTLSKAYFRREVIPFAGCLAATVELAIGYAAIFVVAAIQGIRPTVTVVAIPLIVAVLVVYTVAIAVLLGTVTVFVRDVAHAMPTVAQVLFLASPILYPQSQIPPNLAFLGVANPVAVVAEANRDVTLSGIWPQWGLLGIHLAIGSALLVGAVLYLRSIEDRIVDVV